MYANCCNAQSALGWCENENVYAECAPMQGASAPNRFGSHAPRGFMHMNDDAASRC